MAQAVFLSRTTTRKLQHQLQWKIKNQRTHRKEVHFRLRSLRHHQAVVLPLSLNHQPVVVVAVRHRHHHHHHRHRQTTLDYVLLRRLYINFAISRQ